MNYEHELRLAWAIAINGVALAAAARAARRASGDPALRLCDAFLWWWLIQYAAVAGCGVAGLLTPAWISVAALIVSGLLWFSSRGPVADPADGKDRAIFAAAAAFVTCFVLAAVWDARFLPAVGDDPLTYHLPAATAWLQSGRITIFETWFFNPANAYSPMAGSTFAAWLMAPMDGDVLARFVQAPAVLAIFAAAAAVARGVGAGLATAAIVGVAAALCRPVVTQAILAKDDLFLAAFVLTAIANAGRTDRLAPLRLGAAIGLAAATKYTAIYPLLIPLFLLRRPRNREDWTRAATSAATAVLIAGPWFLRNWIAFGSPIFPIRALGLDGIIDTTVSPRLHSLDGLRASLIDNYFAAGWPLAIALAAMWLVALALATKRWPKWAAGRCVLFGPPACIAAFVLTSPFAEVRFLTASVALLAVCPAVLGVRRSMAGLIAASVLAAVAVFTSFDVSWVARFATAAAIGAAAFVITTLAWQHRRRSRPAIVGVAVLAGFASIWVGWRAYVTSLPEAAHVAWSARYGPIADGWRFVRDELPPGEPIAYANTYLVYPLMGPSLDRSVLHVPVSPRVRSIADLPPIGQPVEETTLLPRVLAITRADADREAWRRRVLESPAKFLFVARTPIVADQPPPPELAWAAEDAANFRLVFENDAAAIYAVRR